MEKEIYSLRELSEKVDKLEEETTMLLRMVEVLQNHLVENSKKDLIESVVFD